MNAEILTVGTELLLGDILNTNAQYLATELARLGIPVHYQSTVGDNPERLRRTLAQALERSDIILTSGGLGPTKDDLTNETVCALLEQPLELHEPSLEWMRGYFARTGRTMSSNNEKQAMLPAGCTVFANAVGTAPGCAFSKDGKHILMLPGPPRELIPMFETGAKTYLQQFTQGTIVSRNLRVFGIGESTLESYVNDLVDLANPSCALYAKEGEVLIRVTAMAPDEEQAERLLEPLLGQLRERLGAYIYGEEADSLEQVVVGQLRRHGKTIATAESCTGGLVAEKITRVPGASEVFSYGVCTYANETKTRALGVSARLLAEQGAVCERVAMQMAAGIRERAGADIGVGVTGIAGPGGGSPEKPVGLVYIALADRERVWAQKLLLGRGGAERAYVRNLTSLHLLDLVRRYLSALPNGLEGGASVKELFIDA